MTSEPVSQAPGRSTSGDSLRRRAIRWWSPRQSLSARLLWTFLPIAVLPAAVYWLLADRYLERSESELTSLLVSDATESERTHLGEVAESRVREIAEKAAHMKTVLAGAVNGGAGPLPAGFVADLAETRFSEPLRPGEIEILATEAGGTVFEKPADLLNAAARAPIAALLRRHAAAELEVPVAGEPYLVAIRKVPDLPWDYIRIFPEAAVRRQVDAQVRPIFDAGRRKRNELRALYLATMVALAAALLVATRRAVAPIRKVARFADAITAGRPAPELEGFDRPDEVGRLSRAMRNLDQRMRRRIRSMDGVHELAQTASAMTRAEETYGRLTRQVAELVGATKSWFAIWEPDSRTLVLTPPGYGVPDDRLRGQRLGLLDRGLAIQCYHTGETCLQNDVHADARVSMTLVEALGIERNIVFVPLRTEVGILGVLAVADKPGGFDAEDQAAIEGWADQAAMLLRNARLYEELQKSYERLRDAQRNRDYFLQNINHELRTPLTAILGWSEVLAEDRPDAETVKTAMEQIRRSAQFLFALISDLLDLSRFEEGRTKLEPDDVDLAALVEEAVEPVSIMAEGKGIVVSIVAPARGKATVRVDPMRMRQVLWNLVHNAVKFTNRGGRIDVKAEDGEKGVTFIVADNGVGIDPKDLPFIFERFRQGDGSTTRAYRGMGIGLALAKSYVELHGGNISVESQPGRGTRFTIEVPKRSAASASGPEAPVG